MSAKIDFVKKHDLYCSRQRMSLYAPVLYSLLIVDFLFFYFMILLDFSQIFLLSTFSIESLIRDQESATKMQKKGFIIIDFPKTSSKSVGIHEQVLQVCSLSFSFPNCQILKFGSST